MECNNIFQLLTEHDEFIRNLFFNQIVISIGFIILVYKFYRK